jgi:hypothetical protein
VTPATAIGMLDRELARHGQTIVLSRAGGSPTDATCRGFVRGFKPDEIIGSVQQLDSKVILSPTSLGAGNWPIPVDGDRVKVAGVWKRVMAATGVTLADTVVRVELQVRGS